MLVKEKKIPKYIIEDIEIASDSDRANLLRNPSYHAIVNWA